MTSFTDIFKKSFLSGYSGSEIDTMTVIYAMLVTCVLAAYIFIVYRVVTRKTFYSKNFNISLAAMAVITAGIILTIQSSVVVSLGMVGALSIVRFRTAIKDPMDLVFLFWSISVGIICGAGLIEIAIVVSVLLTIGIAILTRIPVAKAPMILVVNTSDIDSEERVLETVKKYTSYIKVKSRNMTSSTLDLTIEVRAKECGSLVRDVMKVDGVTSASLLSHDGEVTF